MCTLLYSFFTFIGVFYALKCLIVFLLALYKGLIRFVLPSYVKPIDLVKTFGRWAIVTGSTNGIGKEYARQLAAKGLNIVLISRNQQKLDQTADEIRSLGVEVKTVAADFSKNGIYPDIEKELSSIEDIGILVNNVGTLSDHWEAFTEENHDYFSRILNVNIMSALMMTRLVVPRMKSIRKGLIINVGSLSGIVPIPYGSVYSSTKFFITNLTRCLSSELAPYNIQLHCVNPGFVKSDLLSEMKEIHNFFKFIPSAFPTPKRFVRSALRTLNVSIPLFTCGYWPHSIFATVLNFFIPSAAVQAEIVRFLMIHLWGAKQ